jgi:ABC-2 type transport system ATP-binding protein
MDGVEVTTSQVQSNNHQILVARDLHKSYGPRPALRGLSLSLAAGRILGFLGPNGAGKTTSIRILTTILQPDRGRFFVDGTASDSPEKIRRKIGVLPEHLGLPKQITGLEYLTFFGQLYGRTAREARAHGLTLLEEVGLQQRARSLVGTYSHGMRQRLGIARALVNDPVVVFLDEPTLGLDPRGQQELLSLVRRIARERKAGIVLCSHVLSEIESVCDDVIILLEGQVIATGSVDEVLRRAQRNLPRVHVPSPSVAEARQVLEAIPEVIHVTPSGEKEGWLGVQLDHSAEESTESESYVNNIILGALIRAEIPILSFESEGRRLQDVFLQLTEGVAK